MALVPHDGSSAPAEFVPIFADDDDDNTLMIRSVSDMYSVTKPLVSATVATVLSPEQLSEVHAQGSLRDWNCKSDRHMPLEVLGSPTFLSSISIIGNKERSELYAHCTTPLLGSERDKQKNRCDRILMRPLSLTTLRLIKQNAIDGERFVTNSCHFTISHLLISEHDLITT